MTEDVESGVELNFGAIVISDSDDSEDFDPHPVADPHIFAAADELALRGMAWNLMPQKGKYQAYIVFNGLKMGVFETW